MKHFGVSYKNNFPLKERIFDQIVLKLISNPNISSRGAQLILLNDKLWSKTANLFSKIDFEIDKTIVDSNYEKDLFNLIDELRFIKWSVSNSLSNKPHKAIFKLTTWIDTFKGILSPNELKLFSKNTNVEYSLIAKTQFEHVLQSTIKDLILEYLDSWGLILSESDINQLLDNRNKQLTPERNRFKNQQK